MYQIISAIPGLLAIFAAIIYQIVKKRPLRTTLIPCFLGIIIIIPCAFLEHILGGAFLFAGIIEESFRFIAIFLAIMLFRKKYHFDQLLDFMICALVLSGGFTLLENILWTYESIGDALLRVFVSSAGHILFGLLISLGIYLFLKEKKNRRLGVGLGKLIGMFLLAVIWHTIHDEPAVLFELPFSLYLFTVYTKIFTIIDYAGWLWIILLFIYGARCKEEV